MSGGFAEITPERCTVLADEAMPTAELSRAEGERRLAAAEARYAAADKMDVPALDGAMDRDAVGSRHDRGRSGLTVADVPHAVMVRSCSRGVGFAWRDKGGR